MVSRCFKYSWIPGCIRMGWSYLTFLWVAHPERADFIPISCWMCSVIVCPCPPKGPFDAIATAGLRVFLLVLRCSEESMLALEGGRSLVAIGGLNMLLSELSSTWWLGLRSKTIHCECAWMCMNVWNNPIRELYPVRVYVIRGISLVTSRLDTPLNQNQLVKQA